MWTSSTWRDAWSTTRPGHNRMQRAGMGGAGRTTAPTAHHWCRGTLCRQILGFHTLNIVRVTERDMQSRLATPRQHRRTTEKIMLTGRVADLLRCFGATLQTRCRHPSHAAQDATSILLLSPGVALIPPTSSPNITILSRRFFTKHAAKPASNMVRLCSIDSMLLKSVLTSTSV